jgi:anti-sigma factor (TIGR02949 family)
MTLREIECEEALGHLFAFLDHELDSDEREAMQYHLSRCRSCYSRASFEQRMKDRLRELREDSDASARARIERLLQSF